MKVPQEVISRGTHFLDAYVFLTFLFFTMEMVSRNIFFYSNYSNSHEDYYMELRYYFLHEHYSRTLLW